MSPDTTYQRALDETPLTGWTVFPVWLDLEVEQMMSHRETEKNYERQLREDVAKGLVTPHSFLDLLPARGAIGAQLLDCFLSVQALEEFAAKVRIAVVVAVDSGDAQESTAGAKPPSGESTKERLARVLRWYQEEVERGGERGALARLTKRDGRKRQTVTYDLRRAREQAKRRDSFDAISKRLAR